MSTPTGATISNIKLESETVTKTGHWTYLSGKLTFKSAYLATLSEGEKEFVITMSNSDTVSVFITIGA